MKNSRLLIRCLLPLFVMLWACSDAGPGGGDEAPGLCAADDDCASGEVCLAGVCVSDGTDVADTPLLDVPDVDDTSDAGQEDIAPDVDGTTLGGFQSPCETDADCESGYCIDTDEGRLCTVPCVDSCPDEDWECRLLPGQGADLERLCVPRIDDLCDPCDGDIECGGLADRCINYEDGDFCSRACLTNEDCPESYECEIIDSEDGSESLQCVNTLGICGACLDRDDDGFGTGPGCLGTDCRDDDPNTYEGAAELCDTVDNSCDGEIDEGFDLLNDVEHCGACGVVCDVDGAVAACVDGACAVGACDDGFYDLNGLPEDGCEYACVPNETTGGVEVCNDADDDCDGVVDNGFDLGGDTDNCGRCGNVCELTNATEACEAGACVVAVCEGTFADCNLLSVDGCEVDTTADDDHCGGCAQECQLTNASSACVDSTCEVATCVEPWTNCDNDAANGCEVNVLTDDDNCGECGNICSADGGLGSCQSGVCRVDLCGTGLADCDELESNGCEVNILEDVNNCGACGFVCDLPNATATCSGARCAIDSCDPGFFDSNGLAEDGCEYACIPNLATGGVEICNEIDDDCDGTIDNGFDFSSDIENCGGCGQICDPVHADGICAAGTCTITRCELGFSDCNGVAFDGCEVATAFDALNCGGCGVVCDVPNGDASCFAGACLVDECDDPYFDCDTNPRNGCEANLDTSEAHCGTCFSVCAVAGGVGLCDEGDCNVGLCNGDRANCDARVDNGCEVDLGTDPLNCGGCDVSCQTPNAQSRCIDRSCEVLGCDPGFRDCDGLYGTGCEANIGADINNCGGCGIVCDYANADAVCVGGSCAINACDPGFSNCDGLQGNGCEANLFADGDNCGRCGESCDFAGGAGFCDGGLCQIGLCQGTLANCDFDPTNGCEANLATDPRNCGLCNTVCRLPNATAGCASGACIVAECDPGFANCDGLNENGCEVSLDDDTDNCGRCGLQCLLDNADAACVEGNCRVDECEAGFGDCDLLPVNGCESNLRSDDDNCGICDFDCGLRVGPETVCVNTVCEVRDCLGDTRDCNGNLGDGCEIDTATDVNNCGGCGTVCDVQNAGEQCVAGVCQIAECIGNWVDCDGVYATGCEVNLANDANNCGDCGQECDLFGASEICIEGTCGIGECQGTSADCDLISGNGCEANTATDAMNCGGCGTVCALPGAVQQCSGGFCTIAECAGDFENCNGLLTDGCEVDLDIDAMNCGGCGIECDGERAFSFCQGGFCTVGACDVGYGDCDGVESNGCESDLNNDLDSCGGCDMLCSVANGSPLCVEGSCEIDACIGDFADCDGLAFTGCEANTANSLDHCGGCDMVCDFAGASEACSAGGCVFLGCDEGFIDLNNDESDGCEYACVPTSDVDEPDDLFIDANCDGVDGMADEGIFVSPLGFDTNSGLSANAPLATLARAMVVAGALDERDTIFVEVGDYSMPTAASVVGGVRVVGGYSNGFTVRSSLRPVMTSETSTALLAVGLREDVEIIGVNFATINQVDPGAESVVVRVSDSRDHLTLVQVELRAGRGGAGEEGLDGTSGGRGTDGRDASGATGGGGGVLGGSSGGSGRRRDTGPRGTDGADNGNASTCGGAGGAGGSDTGCFDGNPPAGLNGGNGCSGRDGANGAGGPNRGSFSGVTWLAANGGDGAAGVAGGGGGGGGAGGGEDCNVLGVCIFCGTGRGGGGGGGGGRGGSAGTGGGGGGTSVGMLIVGSSVTVEDVFIVTTGGGRGGAGGAQGPGGAPGLGGEGAINSSNTDGDGGDGGAGGVGGAGGCGGGGGGGASIGVWGTSGASMRQVGTLTVNAGSGGAGGASCQNPGATGDSQSFLDVTLF